MRRIGFWLGIVGAIASAGSLGCAVGAEQDDGIAESEALRDREPRARDRRREQQNEAIVARLYRDVLANGDLGALDDLVAARVLSHDPAIGDGRAALRGWIADQRAAGQAFTVKHTLADGDLVVVHHHRSTEPADERTGSAVFALYLLDRGAIVEHWAVAQPVSAESANGHSAFSDLYRYPGHPRPPSEGREDRNERLAVWLSAGVFNHQRFELLERFWAEDYLQHNPLVADGRAGLAAILPVIAPPGSRLDHERSLADGDLVFQLGQGLPPGADRSDERIGTAIGDLYRVVDDRLVEHWDALQPVPPETASGHSMFSSLYRGDRHR